MPTVFDLHVPIKALISPVKCFLGEIQKFKDDLCHEYYLGVHPNDGNYMETMNIK